MAEAEPQLDRSRGPVMETGLVSGCSSAAFRGLMELKWTTERQPVKPREPSLSRSGSKSSEPEERGRKTARSGRRSASSLITADRLSLPEAHNLKLRPNTVLLASHCPYSPWAFPKTRDFRAFNSPSDVRLKSSLAFWSIWNNQHTFSVYIHQIQVCH